MQFRIPRVIRTLLLICQLQLFTSSAAGRTSMTTWCMLSIASSHCILTVSRDFYPKIRRRLKWKILAATWNWNDLTWLGAAKSTNLTAATPRSKHVCLKSNTISTCLVIVYQYWDHHSKTSGTTYVRFLQASCSFDTGTICPSCAKLTADAKHDDIH